MNLLKIFFLISFTIFVVANENNQTNDSNQSNHTPIIIGVINKNIIVKTDSKNNEFLDWKITIGNPNTQTMEIEGNFKIIDISGNIINETNAKFSIPPRKARIYKTNSLIANVSKDTKAYILADIGGVVSRSNYFIIHK